MVPRFLFFFMNATATTEIYTLSLHDALPICEAPCFFHEPARVCESELCSSEEHTSELQSRENLVCRLLLEKKKSTSSRRPHAATDSIDSVSAALRASD